MYVVVMYLLLYCSFAFVVSCIVVTYYKLYRKIWNIVLRIYYFWLRL